MLIFPGDLRETVDNIRYKHNDRGKVPSLFYLKRGGRKQGDNYVVDPEKDNS